MLPEVSREQIEAALTEFDVNHRGTPEFAGWEAKESQRYALRVADRLYPPKKIVALATGVPVSGFSGGLEANSYLASHGFEVEYINLPSENEVRIALHELLVERGAEGVVPPDAYATLGHRFRLPARLLDKRIGTGEGESHWENRVRFARRKLVTESRLDGSERGLWKLGTRAGRKVWVEKCTVAGRPDREIGPYALGKALWSPKRTRDDADAYWAMRDVQEGDLVVHLVDNRRFAGVSVAAARARTDFEGLAGTDWAGRPGYLIELREFEACSPDYPRAQLLNNPAYEDALRRVRATHKHLFYDRDLNLNQGYYLTEAVPQLALLMNTAFSALAGTGLPHFTEDLVEELELAAEAAPEADGEGAAPPPSGEEAVRLDAAREILETAPAGRTAWLFAPGEGARLWDGMRLDGTMAIGGSGLDDLTGYGSKEAIAARIQSARGGAGGYPRHDAQACWDFVHTMRPGDLVVAKRGQHKLLGYGVIRGEYRYEAGREYPHVRDVEWKLAGEWPAPDLLVTKTLTAKSAKQAERLLAAMQPIGSPREVGLTQPSTPVVMQPVYSLEDLCEEVGVEQEIAELWLARLQRKRQVILYGPPGTGKTFIAERLARHLVSETAGRRTLVQFHPSYSYEDFITGLRPEPGARGLSFQRVPGRFVELCREARRAGRDVPFVLVVDEINRANLSKVFGELLYALEYRDHLLHLPGDKEPFSIPENVYLIGTMNTADRSVALVDHALRRRFAFIRLRPDYALLERALAKHGLPGDGLVRVLRRVNDEIGDENYHIGISFFLQDGGDLRATLGEVWAGEVEPYLEEFFYGREDRLAEFRWERLADGDLADWTSAE